MSLTIVDVVEKDEEFQQIIQQLLHRNYLAAGVFHPRAYLVDTEAIEQAWRDKSARDRISAIAMGTSINNNLFCEVFCRVLRGEEPQADAATSKKLESWTKQTRQMFPDDVDRIAHIALSLGQYLEFMNRKSQGF